MVESYMEVSLRDPETDQDLGVPLMAFLDFASVGMVSEIKTCARKTQPSQWSLQLAAYRYAYRKTTGCEAQLRVVELIKTKEPKIEVIDALVTDRNEAWFLEVAGEVLHGIAAGAFFPNPSWMCTRCEYRRACRGQ